MTTFCDLFSYRDVKVVKYPSYHTVLFTQIKLLRDVEVKLGQGVVVTLTKGMILKSAVWMRDGNLFFRCGSSGEIAINDMKVEYTTALKEMKS